jgi:hypothetical protein
MYVCKIYVPLLKIPKSYFQKNVYVEFSTTQVIKQTGLAQWTSHPPSAAGTEYAGSNPARVLSL